jgi:acetyl-CoA carboxylase biotin carboxyl carrier protein
VKQHTAPINIPPFTKANMAQHKIVSEVTGTVWKIELPALATFGADAVLMVIESMKMEIPVASEKAGKVMEYLVAEGDPVEEGQVIAIVEA